MSTYLTAFEAAAHLKVSADWIRRQCARRALPATKVGKEWRIRLDDLDGFMSKHRGTGVPTPQPRAAGSSIHRHVHGRSA